MKITTISLAAIAALAPAGPASAATVLFEDNFNTAKVGASVFNDAAARAADQSGTAGNKTYTIVHNGWDGAYQRGNGGTWLMHAKGDYFTIATNTNSRGSLDYDIAAAANTLGSPLEIQFSVSVLNSVPTSPPEAPGDNWTSFTIGGVNPFVNEGTVGFSSLFRDNGGTQQFSNGAGIGSSATFTDGNTIKFVLSNAAGTGSAFNSDGATDIVKMYVGATLTNTFVNLDLNTADQFISFHANQTETQIDNLKITAIPEPSAVALGVLAAGGLLLRRRRR